MSKRTFWVLKIHADFKGLLHNIIQLFSQKITGSMFLWYLKTILMKITSFFLIFPKLSFKYMNCKYMNIHYLTMIVRLLNKCTILFLFQYIIQLELYSFQQKTIEYLYLTPYISYCQKHNLANFDIFWNTIVLLWMITILYGGVY